MSSLSISVSEGIGGQPVGHGLVARVRMVKAAVPGEGTGARYWQGSVPMGPLVQAKPVQLEPGTYAIELVLPSGAVMTEYAELGSGCEHRVRFALPDIRPELPGRLGGHTSGPMEPGLVVGGRTMQEAASSRGRLGAGVRWQDPIVAIEVVAGSPEVTVVEVDHSALVWDWWSSAVPGVVDGVHAADRPSDREEAFLQPTAGCRMLRVHVQDGSRVFATVSNGGFLEIASLPVFAPEGGPDDFRSVRVETEDRGRPGDFRLRVSTSEPETAALTGYIEAGNLMEARVVLDDLIDDLGWDALVRSAGPITAAGAAYVALATEDDPDRRPWESWLRELVDTHPWLPDAAIVLGRWKLKFAQTHSDVDHAAAWLKAGYEAGIPFFASGVESLADGLGLAAGAGIEDDALAEAGRRVSAMRARVDPGQAFTVFHPS